MITRKCLAADVNIKSFKGGDEDIKCIGKKEFPKGQLPTKKDVIEQLLWEKTWCKKEVAMTISQEIIDIWLFCTVYPTSKLSVQKTVLELVNNFNKLVKYPKLSEVHHSKKK